MRSCRTLFVLALAHTAALAAAPEVKVDVLCTIDCHEAPLRDVAALLEQSAGITVELGPGVAERKLTMAVTNMPLEQLLEEIATLLHLSCEKAAPNRYRLSAAAGAPPRSTPALDFHRETVACRWVPPSRIAALYGGPSMTVSPTGQPLLTTGPRGARCLGVALTDAGTGRLELSPDEDRVVLARPPGVGQLTGDDRLSRLMVSGTAAAVEQVRAEVEALDVPSPTETELKLWVAVLRVDDAVASGAAWAVPPLPAAPNAHGGLALRAVVGPRDRLLTALRGSARVQWLAVPILPLERGEPLLLQAAFPMSVEVADTVLTDAAVTGSRRRIRYVARDACLLLPSAPEREQPERLELRLVSVAALSGQAALEPERVAKGLLVEPGQVLALVSRFAFSLLATTAADGPFLADAAREAKGERLVITFIEPLPQDGNTAQP